MLLRILQTMWATCPTTWSEQVKVAEQILLYKKGDRKRIDNYRGIALLSVLTRLLASITARRIAIWAEAQELMGENQFGFRRGMGTDDAQTVMARIMEESCDWVRNQKPDNKTVIQRRPYWA